MTGAAADRRQEAAWPETLGRAGWRLAATAPVVVLPLADGNNAPPVKSPVENQRARSDRVLLTLLWPRPDKKLRWLIPDRRGWLARSSGAWSGSLIAHAAVALLGAGWWFSPPPELPTGGEETIELEVIVASPSDAATGEAGARRAEPDLKIPLPDEAEVAIRPQDISPQEPLQPAPVAEAPAASAPPPTAAVQPEPQIDLLPPDPAVVTIAPDDTKAERAEIERVEAARREAVRAAAARREAQRAEARREEARREVAEREEARREAAPREEARREEARREAAERAAKREAARRQAAEGQGDSGRGRDRADTSPASPASASGGRDDTAGRTATANYQGQIMAHLARHKRYPETARAQGLRGRAVVRFTIDANGRVTGVALAGSSGAAILDAETQAMVQRASPFPPIPREIGRSSMSFTAPVSFSVKTF